MVNLDSCRYLGGDGSLRRMRAAQVYCTQARGSTVRYRTDHPRKGAYAASLAMAFA